MLNPRDITACVPSTLLSARNKALAPTIGLTSPAAARQHWAALGELDFRAAGSNYEDTYLEPGNVARFHAAFGRVAIGL
jgi:hypothetical protein